MFTKNTTYHIIAGNMERYLDPRNDYAFRKIFSDEPSLKDFINRILNLSGKNKIKKISPVSVEELPPIVRGRISFFSIKVMDGRGRSYIIQMQRGHDKSFIERLEPCAAHGFVDQLEKGEELKHDKLLPVIAISITEQLLFPDIPHCVSTHRMKEDVTNKVCLKHFTFVFAELSKLKEEGNRPVKDWLHLFAHANEEEKAF